MKRIDIINSILPNYNRYHAKAIYLPFPDESIYKGIIQNSIKGIPKENLFEKFDIHINQIWIKAIMRNYSFKEIYYWQEQHVEFRKKSLEFIKSFNRIIEFVIENKKTKIYSKSIEIDKLYQEILVLSQLKKEYPHASQRYSDKAKFKDEISQIDTFNFPLSNFFNQHINIFDKDSEQKSNLAIYNYRDAFSELNSMQTSFETIQNETHTYFDMQEIKEEEKIWFARLLKTMSYYISNPIKKAIVAKESIEFWWTQTKEKELSQIHKILKNFEQNLSYKVIHPSHIIETSNMKEIVVGIENINVDDFDKILFELVDFNTLDIHFVNIIHIKNNEALYGLRIPKTYFEQIRYVLDGGEYEEYEFGNPYPINITNELLEALSDKVTLKVVENNTNGAFIAVMFDIWRLTEYRNRVDKNSDIEREWLEEKEVEFSKKIKQELSYFSEDLLFKDSKLFFSKILDEKIDISQSEILNYMNKKIKPADS